MKKIFSTLLVLVVLSALGCKDKSEEQNVQDTTPNEVEQNQNISPKDVREIHVISPTEVKEAVYDHQNQQLVDVRTPEEFKEGHLKNAVNICVTDDDFEENIKDLDKDKPVYLYCRSGKRSAMAAKKMKELGFKEIYDMEGGYLNWESQNLETEH